MRQFKLRNSTGAEWNLMSKQSYFNAPSGLGFSKTYTTMQSGTAWLITDEAPSQSTISGEMVFFSYAKYQEFVSFISKTPLYLMYAPQSTWYTIKCNVQTLSKGEFKNAYLSASIVFICFGMWYEAVTAAQAELTGEMKRYSYSYPYTYAETATGTVAIKNGSLNSPCRLHIMGACTNPTWALSKSGERVLTGKVTVTIPAGHKLVVDADPDTMEIAEYTTDGEFVRDLYQYSDFSTARFVYAPLGDSTLTFSHDGTGDIKAWVEVERLAYSV